MCYNLSRLIYVNHLAGSSCESYINMTTLILQSLRSIDVQPSTIPSSVMLSSTLSVLRPLENTSNQVE